MNTMATSAPFQQPGPQKLLSNNAALVGWIFMFVWIAILCMNTWLFARGGRIDGLPTAVSIGVMALFWGIGLFACRYFFGLPRTSIWLENGRLSLRESWLFSSREAPLTSGTGDPVHIREEKDFEGDTRFVAYLRLPSAREIKLKESGKRELVEAAHQRLLDAIAASKAGRTI